jgi:hypothetical protein
MRVADCVFQLRIPDSRAGAGRPQALSIDLDHCIGRCVKYHRCDNGKIAELYFAHDETLGALLARSRLSGFDVNSDYHDAPVEHRDRHRGRFFARNADKGNAVYRSLLVRFAERDDGVSRFRDVMQKREQIGRAGYQ